MLEVPAVTIIYGAMLEVPVLLNSTYFSISHGNANFGAEPSTSCKPKTVFYMVTVLL